jgi:hypothetical protein
MAYDAASAPVITRILSRWIRYPSSSRLSTPNPKGFGSHFLKVGAVPVSPLLFKLLILFSTYMWGQISMDALKVLLNIFTVLRYSAYHYNCFYRTEGWSFGFLHLPPHVEKQLATWCTIHILVLKFQWQTICLKRLNSLSPRHKVYRVVSVGLGCLNCR